MAIKVFVVCLALAVILLSKPLARVTAECQRMVGLGAAANETVNRVLYVLWGALFLILAAFVK